MAYLPQDDINIVSDITKRKEFYQTKKVPQIPTVLKDIIPEFLIDDYKSKGMYLDLRSYQIFVKNYININTPYTRLLIKHSTGSGKSIGALSISMNFINFYRNEQLAGSLSIGSVFIIGFSERIFKNELLRFPSFGFLSADERRRLERLRRSSANGNSRDFAAYTDLRIRIRKRFSNRKGNGFFKFYGYKSFVGKIFSSNVNLQEMSEEKIVRAVEKGEIKLNQTLLAQFKNSLIICDEIHNVYNSNEKNNWGIAIQAVLDYSPTTRAVFMSATPLNNNPSEIIDLMNLLLPKSHRLKKDKFFNTNKSLKPESLKKLSVLSKGRVSFLRDINPQYYPQLILEGESLASISALKFIRCPMSQYHYNTYKQVYSGALSQDSQYLIDFILPNPDKKMPTGLYQTTAIKAGLIHASNEWKKDFGINYVNGELVGNILLPQNLIKYSTKYHRMLEEIMLVITGNKGKLFIYHNIVHMSGVLFIKQILLHNGFLLEHMQSSPSTICQVCGKRKSSHAIDGGAKKTSLYVVKSCGLNKIYIPEIETSVASFIILGDYKFMPVTSISTVILKQNKSTLDKLRQFIIKNKILVQTCHSGKKLRAWLGLPTVSTVKYVYCGKSSKKIISKILAEYNKYIPTCGGVHKHYSRTHKFVPARFIMAHSDIDKGSMDQSIEKFNAPENTWGRQIMILVGSKIIRESYNLKAVQNNFIMGRPDNIPTFKQIQGRSVRNNSHILLPLENRKVYLKIFTSCLPILQTRGRDKGKYAMGYEEIKYMEKMEMYKIIQKIEREVFHKNAIDSVINRDIIWSENDKDEKSKNTLDEKLTNLWFEPELKMSNLNLKKLNLSTFNVYYAEDEINRITILIKRLFIEVSPVFDYKTLFAAVKNPVTSVHSLLTEVNAGLFSEDNFINSLSQLVWDNSYIPNRASSMFIDRLLDPGDKIIITPNGNKNSIVHLGDYYILLPLDTNDMPIYDVETIYRTTEKYKPTHINIDSFLSNRNIEFDYTDKMDIFRRRWKNVSINNMQETICDYGIFFHVKLIEECIEYVFNMYSVKDFKKSPHHKFYLKMLYYYDSMNLIIFASTVDVKTKSRYKKYLKTEPDKPPAVEQLKANLSHSSDVWINSQMRAEFKNNYEKSLKLFDGTKKVANKLVSPKSLPIGHFILRSPKLYYPEEPFWTTDHIYIKNSNWKENNILIGYDERSKTGIMSRFKIRNPIQNIKKFKDARLIERGSVCKSKSKEDLFKVADDLNIKIKGKLSVKDLCKLIRTNMMRKELHERSIGSNIKWFYFHYETRPETFV